MAGCDAVTHGSLRIPGLFGYGVCVGPMHAVNLVLRNIKDC